LFGDPDVVDELLAVELDVTLEVDGMLEEDLESKRSLIARSCPNPSNLRALVATFVHRRVLVLDVADGSVANEPDFQAFATFLTQFALSSLEKTCIQFKGFGKSYVLDALILLQRALRELPLVTVAVFLHQQEQGGPEASDQRLPQMNRIRRQGICNYSQPLVDLGHTVSFWPQSVVFLNKLLVLFSVLLHERRGQTLANRDILTNLAVQDLGEQFVLPVFHIRQHLSNTLNNNACFELKSACIFFKLFEGALLLALAGAELQRERDLGGW